MDLITISIIGLGQIGTSIGLALSNQEKLLRRVGNDRDLNVAKRAERMGALDRVEVNIPNAVSNADLVLLCLPIDQIREMLELIAPDLKEGAVVMDTGPIKGIVASWANELLTEGRHYVGLTPVINPVYLHETDSGIEAAQKDLFKSGLMAIVAAQNTNSAAIKLAADLTRLLGAMPLFADPAEIDGLMAATHLLPQLTAAALLNATVDQPGWREGRKVAGRAYAEATAPVVHPGDAQTLKESAMLNSDNTLRVIDGTIAALEAIRNDIAEKDGAALQVKLDRALGGREKWWKERLAGDWMSEERPVAEVPRTSSMLGRMFLGTRPKKSKKGNK